MHSALRTLLCAVLALCAINGAAFAMDAAAQSQEFFEKKIRPLLVERCHKCHAGMNAKGGLRLDSREAVLKGGELGPAVVPEKPDESLLLQAVRRQNGLEMPPDEKLKDTQVADLAAWIRAGAPWPRDARTATTSAAPAAAAVKITPPDSGQLGPALQIWLSADSLTLDDGEPVYVWPDRSGHGRDVTATKGVRAGGVGLPGRFAKQSTLLRRPAVRFETSTGLASSPDNPVDIRGDAELTIMLVVNLQPHEVDPPYHGVFSLGNPAHAGDPGRPLAALVEIDGTQDHSLDFAGGWAHDASPGPSSFKPLFGKPIILTITKRPGPMRETTRFFINGELAGPLDGKPLSGRDTVPDIQHRPDVGVFLGKALGWCGSIQGDIGEVLVYNRMLDDAQRLGVEGHLADKFGLLLKPVHNVAPRAVFTAEEKSHWAYQPVRDSPAPLVQDTSWIKSPVDQFILAALEAQGSAPAPPADKRTLLRRVTFDLTGLPPTPEAVDAFLADDSPKAFEKVVSQLLDSPHYGERWARHWLDVVRYAETTANDANAVMRYAWRYRNYVIDAFNNDLPYDQFLIEQLAGDLLPPADPAAVNTRRIIATGFLMLGPKALAETDKEQSRLDIVDDQIDVTGRTMMGLTISCARCHDHKFDAIRTTDYYALAGIFRSTEPFQNENRNATMWWEFPVPQGEGVEPIVVMAPKESQPRNLRVHLRGNRFTLGQTVPRGVLQVIEQGHSASSESDHHGSSLDPSQLSSGRLELARWIASPDNPLTARVMVNRIWQHHFGQGLVATSDNFGTRGQPPTHPELLDWLAARFVESGWSIKAMQRLIVLSSAYQQVRNQENESALRIPNSALRRLSAEELRDAMLFVSGRLDRTPGTNESGEFLYSKAEDIGALIRPNRVAADDPYYTTFAKRSIYMPVVRNMLPDVLALFDAADPNGVTAVRNETTVASQSLFLLNSPFVREQARGFAERLLAEASLSDDGRIELAHKLALGRPPSLEELQESRAFIAAYLKAQQTQARPDDMRQVTAWQSYCQTLICSNEFMYVE